MNKLVASLGLTLAVLASGPAIAEEKPDAPLEIAGASTVDADGLIGLVTGSVDTVLVDSRKAGDYDAGHIEGAVNLVSTDTTADSLAAILPSTDTPVVFYCNGIKCGRAADAVEVAVASGYSNVHYYALGMDEWNELGLPVITN